MPLFLSDSLYCGDNKLTDLVGCPEIIEGTFDCQNNKLASLLGCPIKVTDSFLCGGNLLKDLNYLPEVVGGKFDCSFNKGLSDNYDLLSFAQVKQYISNEKLKVNLDRNLGIGLVSRSVGKKI